jgi:hypothetical protein
VVTICASVHVSHGATAGALTCGNALPLLTRGQVVAGSVLAAQNSVCAAMLAATRKVIIAGGGCQCEVLAR